MDALLKGNVVSGGVSCNQIPQDSLVASYLLQGTAEDETGTYDGTEVGNTYVYDDERGVVASFDGVDDYIQTTFLGTSSFTISLWAYFTSASSNKFIFGKYDGATKLIHLYKNTSNFLLLSIGWTTTVYITSSTAVSLNQWYNIVITHDGTNTELLIDNVSKGTSAVTPDAWIDTIGFQIGKRTDLTVNEMEGQISNVHFYNRALTAQEVTDIYNIEKYQHNNALDEGLIAYYPLDGNSLDNAINQYDGTDVGTTYPSDVDMGVVADFDGTSSHITLPTILANSVSFNFKADSFTSNPTIYDSRVTNCMGIYLALSTGGILQFNAGGAVLDVTTALSIGVWYTVQVTYDGTTFKVYVDNVLELSEVSARAWTRPTHFIGTYDTGSLYRFDGKISKFRLYNRALSAKEIDWLYDYEKPNSTECISNSTIDNPDPFEDGSGIALYKLDGNANDTTGNYDGTRFGTGAYSDGVFGQCALFTAGGQWIDTGITISGTQTFSYMWRALNRGGNGAVNHISGSTSGGVKGDIDNVNDQILYGAGSEAGLYSDWHHIVLNPVNGVINTAYIDGVLYSITEQTLVGNLHIHQDYVYNYGDVEIGQVRVFNRALTADEVTILNNERKA